MKDLTFCLMTCGEETEAECLQAIESFRAKVAFQEVRDISPQVVALNKMLEQCQTSYLVPLDSDIVLNLNAYDRIELAINKHTNWHSILFPLWDTLTEESILALKVLNMKYVTPFQDSRTPDVSHYAQLEATGAKCIHDYLKEEPIGKHVVRGPKFVYSRFYDIYMTFRVHNKIWDRGAFKGGKTIRELALSHYNYFIGKYNKTRNQDYLYAIAGIWDGLKLPLENTSKDLRVAVNCDISSVSREFVSWLMGVEFPKEYLENVF